MFGFLKKRSKSLENITFIDQQYIPKLALLERQLMDGDDFYGHWLEAERNRILADTKFAIPNIILGLIYQTGIHVPKDVDKAESFFLSSIKLGCPLAYKYLAAIENGRGNKERGMKYIEKGISLGDSDAMAMLGLYYVYEITLEGGKPDYKRARKLFKKAANMGHQGAKKNLELMDQRGL